MMPLASRLSIVGLRVKKLMSLSLIVVLSPASSAGTDRLRSRDVRSLSLMGRKYKHKQVYQVTLHIMELLFLHGHF